MKRIFPKLSAEAVIEALRNRHPLPQWVFLTELRLGTGWDGPRGYGREQRIDAWALNCYTSQRVRAVAYEVKVSRSDFLGELKNPRKREQAITHSSQFFYVTPQYMVAPSEVPDDCGLIWVDHKGRTRQAKQSAFRVLPVPDWPFLCSVMRNLRTGGVSAYRVAAQELEAANA